MLTCSHAHQAPNPPRIGPRRRRATGQSLAWHSLAFSGNCCHQPTHGGPPWTRALGAAGIWGFSPDKPPGICVSDTAGRWQNDSWPTGVRRITPGAARGCRSSARQCATAPSALRLRCPPAQPRRPLTDRDLGAGAIWDTVPDAPAGPGAAAIWHSLPDAPPQKWIAWRAHTQPHPKKAPARGIMALPGTVWHLPGPAADCQPANCQRATSL
jgi:hypothetical protein